MNSQIQKTSSQANMEAILVDFYKILYAKNNLDLQIQESLIDDLEFSLT